MPHLFDGEGALLGCVLEEDQFVSGGHTQVHPAGTPPQDKCGDRGDVLQGLGKEGCTRVTATVQALRQTVAQRTPIYVHQVPLLA